MSEYVYMTPFVAYTTGGLLIEVYNREDVDELLKLVPEEMLVQARKNKSMNNYGEKMKQWKR